MNAFYRSSTEDVPTGLRFEKWRSMLESSFFPLECEPLSRKPFSGEIKTIRVGSLNYSWVRSGPFATSRTAKCIADYRGNKINAFLQLRGSSHLSQDGRELAIRPGDFYCLDTSQPYLSVKSEDYESLILTLPRCDWEKRFGPTELLTARSLAGDTPIGKLIGDFLGQIFDAITRSPPSTAFRLAELSVELVRTGLAEITGQGQTSSNVGHVKILARAKENIRQNLHDHELDSEKVAQALRISRRYVQQLFHEEGTTVESWINDQRLTKCWSDLADPMLAGKRVNEIAYERGFKSVSHFNKLFRKAYNATPSEFRRSHRESTDATNREPETNVGCPARWSKRSHS